MYAVSIHPSRPRHLLASALAVALAFGALPLAQAQQPQAASAAANGSDRSIIFVGGRRQQDNTGSATHAQAHPPGPCTSAHARHSSAGDECSLNPQPIPPGRSLHGRTDNTHVQDAARPASEPEAPLAEDAGA